MTRYQMAKLVDWAGEKLESRKRLQKVVFLLQCAKCPLEAEYRLHHFGPYSDEVAHVTDEMVNLDLLDEEERGFPGGNTYNYRLKDKTRERVVEYEKTEDGKKARSEIAGFEKLATELFDRDVKDLEHAATLVYFHKRSRLSWPEAITRTCEMKNLPKQSPAMRRAEALATQILPKDESGGQRGRQNLS